MTHCMTAIFHRRLFVVFAFAFLTFAQPLAWTPLRAQEAETANTEEGAKKSEDKNFFQVLAQGGVVMIFLGVASVLVMTFTIEGLIKLRSVKLAPPALVALLREKVSEGNYQEAWQVASTNRCFLGNVVAAALERVGRGKEAVEFAIQEASVRESTLLKANMMYLSVIGVVAPMIGLTGTVIGMIKAFTELGQSGISNPGKLAEHIGEVLVATAAGLVVAIPAFVFYYVLKNMSVGATLIAEGEVYRLLDDIPYEQLAGVRLGENFTSSPTGIQAASRGLRSAMAARSPKVSQGVRDMAVTTMSGSQTVDYQSWLQQVQSLNPHFQIDGRDPDLRAVYDSGMTPGEVQFDVA
jgi:biopolymer transport protein ExbB